MGEFSYDPFLPSALGPILIFGNDPWLNDLFPRDNEKNAQNIDGGSSQAVDWKLMLHPPRSTYCQELPRSNDVTERVPAPYSDHSWYIKLRRLCTWPVTFKNDK